MTLYRAEQRCVFTAIICASCWPSAARCRWPIENALIFRQVEDSATTDYLSGLPNARSLFLRLDSELARCKRNRGAACVLVCDLDGFKQVNDRFGHLEGNKVLRLVARGAAQPLPRIRLRGRAWAATSSFWCCRVSGPRHAKKSARAGQDSAARAGMEVCGEEFLAISAGEACFPAARDRCREITGPRRPPHVQSEAGTQDDGCGPELPASTSDMVRDHSLRLRRRNR